MTDRKFDKAIRSWLEADAPGQMPDRVLRATFERTRKARQTVGWRALLGRMHVNRFALQLSGAAVITVAVVIGAAYLVPNLNRSVVGQPTPSPSPSPSTTPQPTTPPEVTALLNGFLEARVAGAGAQLYLAVPEKEVPLLYGTTSGAPYDRAEFERVRGVEWPYGLSAFKVRLFAGDTVVEQLLFLKLDEHPLGLSYVPDGFGTHIAPTTEDGKPVAVRADAFDGEVTLDVAHPWVCRGGCSQYVHLIPEDPGVLPTTDGGQRIDWDQLLLMADPALLGADCQTPPSPADAAALAERIRSEPDLGATAPVAVMVGGAEALMMDVKISAGATICGPATDGGDPVNWLLNPVFDTSATVFIDNGVATGQATGEWMRLYLFDSPEGSSIRIMVIAIVAPESRFESVVEAAAPVVDSVEFHAP